MILAYDVTNIETFDKLSIWMKNIQDKASSDVVKFLVANKVDKVDDRKIQTEQGREMAKEYGFEYYETSAFHNINVADMFEAAIAEAYKRLQPNAEHKGFELTKNTGSPSKKCCK